MERPLEAGVGSGRRQGAEEPPQEGGRGEVAMICALVWGVHKAEVWASQHPAVLNISCLLVALEVQLPS